MIALESNVQQNLIHFIMKEIPDPMIGGLLIGKFNQASEWKVELDIDRESSFRDVPASIDRSLLVTIIGNLLDNAMEAVLDPSATDKKVKIFFTDLGEDLIIEVEDTGTGIAEEERERIFRIGYSTKASQHRGYGLGLVQQAVQQLHGHITFSSHEGGGTVFTVDIPKKIGEKVGKAL
ncbi:sensor histidine kinase [Caldalkalibacillus mannanilyticus]|uniref:sensor histidine kinase n=1 Tax=Caldalkalibacillus mannanilyticus TaxID=1418 RepID=UPI000A6F30D6